MNDLAFFKLAVPRDNEYTPESAATMFSSMAYLDRPSWLGERFFNKPLQRFSLETIVVDQKVSFYASINNEYSSYWDSQFQAAYPLGVALQTEVDHLENWKDKDLHVAHIVLAKPYYLLVKTYKEFADVDPMSLILGVLSKAKASDMICFQMVLTGAGNWRSLPERMVSEGIKKADGTTQDVQGKSIIATKLLENAFWSGIRVVSSNPDSLAAVISAFGSLGRGDGNSFKMIKPASWNKKKWLSGFFERRMDGIPNMQVLTVSELATLWHMPNENVKLQNLTWAKNMETEAPDNLPVYAFLDEEKRKNVNFFAKTLYRDADMVFGIKREDRTRHMYVIGKSGVGKSTLLENMAISDMKKGEGMAFLDPHGSSVEHLLHYIPKHRINDVIYFDPSDTEFPISLNILEVTEAGHREFVASGIVSIFNKLYGHSWGPRLEYILRNTLLTLTEVPGTTLPNVIEMLTDANYRKYVLSRISDPVIIKFWNDEYGRMDPRKQIEEVSSILNKVGQFVSSPLIRRIITPSKSSIDFEQVMNEGKILLVNLSQGRLGEDNSALLGAMIITKIQLSAMRRARSPDVKWRDFFLYVDEFQNFATTSFIKILSEARKYRLGLILANQYVVQIEESIMAAIIGNAGTLVTFLLGSPDAQKLEKEFAEVFTYNDLTHLGRGEAVLKLAIDGLTSRPFFIKTLPPAASSNQNKDKVIRVSREHWASKEK